MDLLFFFGHSFGMPVHLGTKPRSRCQSTVRQEGVEYSSVELDDDPSDRRQPLSKPLSITQPL